MANQRKAGKKKVNVWLTDAEKSALEKAAKERGMTLTITKTAADSDAGSWIGLDFGRWIDSEKLRKMCDVEQDSSES